MSSDGHKPPVQPVSGTVVPRFAGPSTFARLPELRDVTRCDVAILGIPFDGGTSYRRVSLLAPVKRRRALLASNPIEE
jgi:agmatinase